MPELPEIANRTQEIKTSLIGKRIVSINILQPKCLNLDTESFQKKLSGAAIQEASYKGKWIFIETSQGWLLLNMGMGGELILTDPDHLPEKHRLVFYFSDQTCLAVNFWWFGYAHFVEIGQLEMHEMSARLGPNVLDLSHEEFYRLISNRKGTLKSYLLNQGNVAGIGNAYIHDILFFAKLHPMRSIPSLSIEEISNLYVGIQKGLRMSLEKGGAFYELNLYGKKGGFLMEDHIIAYREEQPCPNCGTPIQKIKTGSNSSFICPNCQPLSE